MVNIKIKIGHCGCFFNMVEHYGKICWREKTIYLGSKLDDKRIYKVLNHEVLHLVIDGIEGRLTSQRFDSVFHIEPYIEKILEECNVDGEVMTEDNGAPALV